MKDNDITAGDSRWRFQLPNGLSLRADGHTAREAFDGSYAKFRRLMRGEPVTFGDIVAVQRVGAARPKRQARPRDRRPSLQLVR